MLININPILNPELLYHMRAMGHGDKLVLTNANFPATSHALSNKVIRLDGVNIYEATKAILSVFPLDSFIDSAASRMQVDNKPDELTECHKDFINAVRESAGENWKVGSIERQDFYREAKNSYLIVSTSETRPYGCFILTKGVIKPDGSVWVLDK